MSNPKPENNVQHFLAKIAGVDTSTPTPQTTEEYYLEKIVDDDVVGRISELEGAISLIVVDKETYVNSHTVAPTVYQQISYGIGNYIAVENKKINKVILRTKGLSTDENAYRLQFRNSALTEVLFVTYATGQYSDGTIETIEFDCNGLELSVSECYITFLCAGKSISTVNSTTTLSDICIADNTHKNKQLQGAFYDVSPVNSYYADFDIVYIEKTVDIPNDAVDTPAIADKAVTPDKLSYEAQLNFKLDIFNRVGACGDSFIQGVSAGSDGNWSNKQFSWFDKMAKRCGLDYLNCAVGGSTTRSWLTNASGLQKTLAADPCDFYFLGWGINDANLGTSYIGTIDDIHDDDYTLNADTFYGNYGKIIAQLKAHSPNARFVLIGIWYKPYAGSGYTAFNTAIEAIAEHYGAPYIYPLDDDFFATTAYRTQSQYHPTPLAYCGMATAMERLFNKAVIENESYFRYANIEP